MIYNFEELSFQILSIFQTKHKDGFFRVDARPYAALAIRLRGSSEFSVAQKRISVGEGDVLFIPADLPYEAAYEGSEMIVIHFRSCNYSEPEFFRPCNRARLRALFLRLLSDWNGKCSVNLAKSQIYEILDTMASDKKSALQSAGFERCLQYMEENFCDPEIDIAKVCRIGFISQSGLQRAFYQHCGMAPKAYLTKLRVSKALELLAENTLTVKEIAFRCGFSDEKFFSRVIKKKYGFSPTQMRKNMIV